MTKISSEAVEQAFAYALMLKSSIIGKKEGTRVLILDMELPVEVAEAYENLLKSCPQDLKGDMAKIAGVAFMRGIDAMAG